MPALNIPNAIFGWHFGVTKSVTIFTQKVMMDTFGEWLLQQRNLRRLTREEFANRVGCSVAMLRKIENCERRPSTQIAELIANTLEIPPAEHAIFVRVARGELSAERLSEAKPANTTHPPTSKNNLPILPTPLIGRQREVDELIRLLGDPQCRLLTLVGPGGIGKTRLAIEAASRIQNEFSNGVVFVPFAPVNSSRFIIPVIANSIGFTFQGETRAEPRLQLLNHLKGKKLLLLVDNIEHLLKEPDIELFSDLLAAAPDVKLLMTSREPLGFQAEWVFEVHGLPIPGDLQTETFVQDTSIELFIQRARRAHAGFSVNTEDLPAVARICRLVDGTPLGIELAAAWVRTLSCEEIEHEIERGLEILHVSTRDLPARHRSMRAVFEHSWKLLDEEEQQVLARLSVFRGGFRRAAAEQVAQATLTILSALVAKSLVRRRGDGRYDLHELIRQFAADQLAGHPEEQTSTQELHVNYYLTFFGNSEGRLHSSAQGEALTELTLEMDNFRVAWDQAVLQSQFALIEQALESFVILYHIRGWFREGVDSLDRAINALETTHQQSLPDKTDQIALAYLLFARSNLAYELGQYEQTQIMLERSLAILRPYNESRIIGPATILLGAIMLVIGNFGRALELYNGGLEIAKSTDNRLLVAGCLIEKAKLALIVDDAEKAYEQAHLAVEEWRAIGTPSSLAYGLILLGQSASALGRYNEAQLALEESILLINSVGDRTVLGLAYRGLGQVAQVQGKHMQAVEMFRKAVDIFDELGTQSSAALGLAQMGHSFFALGDDYEASHVWSESLRIAIDTKGIFIALEALAGLARLQAKQGDKEYALEVALMILNHPACSQETKKRANLLKADLEAQLTSAEVEVVQTHVGEKNFEMIVEEALKNVTH